MDDFNDIDFEDFDVPAYTKKEYQQAVDFLDFLKHVLRTKEYRNENPKEIENIKKNIAILEDRINHLS